MNTQTISTVDVTVQNMSTGNNEVVDLHPGLTLIAIKYPEGYSGPRMMVEGKTYPVSKETADLLVSKGIASITESVENVSKETTESVVEVEGENDQEVTSAEKEVIISEEEKGAEEKKQAPNHKQKK